MMNADRTPGERTAFYAQGAASRTFGSRIDQVDVNTKTGQITIQVSRFETETGSRIARLVHDTVVCGKEGCR
jgi:hypothetical protein